MIDAEIVPELALRCSIWELFLGMPVQQVIGIFKKLEGVITNVDVWYSEQSPFDYDIVLCLPADGLRFHFDPKWQRLKLIEVTDLSKISLHYLSHHVNPSNMAPTLATVIKIFGSTKHFLRDEEPGYFRLCYRGLTFLASYPPEVDVMGAAGLEGTTIASPSIIEGSTRSEVGLAESEEEQLFVRRILIFPGQNVDEAKLPPQLPVSCYHGNIFLERLLVVHANDRTVKLCFDLICQDLSFSPPAEPGLRRFSSCVAFGDSTEDVLSALGSPSRVFYKTDDKMMIHLPHPYRQGRQQRCDYFYNYFTLGLDILFDSRTHRVITFVLHTNQPGEYTFNTYYRCMFEIPLSITSDDGSVRSVVIDPFVKVRSLLGGVFNKEPVDIHRETVSRNNSFATTEAYNYRDLIFEVLRQSGYLASVTIYSLPNEISS